MLLYQVSLTDDELEEIFRKAPAAPSANLVAEGAVTAAFRESQQEDEDSVDGDDPECPICFDAMDEPALQVRCTTCRGRFHGLCMAQVLQHTDGTKKCPLCRGKWEERAGEGSVLNLAKHSSKHKHGLTLAQLYPDSHQYIGGGMRGRGRGFGRGSGRGRGAGPGRGRGRVGGRGF